MFIFCPSFDYINQPECLQKRHFALHDEKSVAKKCALNIVSVQPIVLDLILPPGGASKGKFSETY